MGITFEPWLLCQGDPHIHSDMSPACNISITFRPIIFDTILSVWSAELWWLWSLVCFYVPVWIQSELFSVSQRRDEQTLMPEPSHFKLNTAGFILLCHAGAETVQLKPVTTHQSCCTDTTWRAGGLWLVSWDCLCFLLHVSWMNELLLTVKTAWPNMNKPCEWFICTS